MCIGNYGANHILIHDLVVLLQTQSLASKRHPSCFMLRGWTEALSNKSKQSLHDHGHGCAHNLLSLLPLNSVYPWHMYFSLIATYIQYSCMLACICRTTTITIMQLRYSYSLQFFIMSMVLLNVKLVSLICRRSPRLRRFLASSITVSMWLWRQHWAESFRHKVKPLPVKMLNQQCMN